MSLLLTRLANASLKSNSTIGLIKSPRPAASCLINFSLLRYKAHVPSKYKPKQELPSEVEWKHLKEHIPGEKNHTNTLQDRIPKFPLGKENVPTLLPRPGVPQVGKQFTFRQVINILKNKKQPELIYESEPHRLYFLMSVCFALVFTIYGGVLFEWAFWISGKEYEENETEQANEVIRKRDWLISLGKYLVPSAVIFGFAYFAALFPTRLIRRIWFLPGPVEHIKFTSYPLFPGRPTPVYTVPLANLSRRKTARVWTGKGFYGTSDKGMFFFILKEHLANGGNKNWIIDRRGFFWSDGRVFDYLFGKESLAESEAGVPYDAQFGLINSELKKKKRQLRQEHGWFWRFKMAGKLMMEDARKVGSYIGIGKPKEEDKSLPKGDKK
ncbi:uncharacterized protein J8A68_002468 [[Candida] subhashii]|uniref:Uncharacterized protein n=1 Tax=[Candida] subhashii TaxID=561895 RepID=A0A8J5QXG8_9ASCO|nr:uncharacterized protein J8A68_002468 [[Candida] subhashii]KAG7664030.1 hypothetical protein J8A68_002468 [[Candida] subhashii]